MSNTVFENIPSNQFIQLVLTDEIDFTKFCKEYNREEFRNVVLHY